MFTNQQLQELIDGGMIGNKFPYDTKSEQEVEAHIRRLFYRMKRIPNLICEAEWDHFGSGYASFVEFFCYRKEDVTIIAEQYGRREEMREGIIINVCRLAPVAIIGEDERYKTFQIETNEEVGGAYGTLLDGPQRLSVSEKFQPVVEKLKQALTEFDYELLEPEKLNKRLPFKKSIPTLYREPGSYLIMDALFYWED